MLPEVNITELVELRSVARTIFVSFFDSENLFSTAVGAVLVLGGVGWYQGEVGAIQYVG